MLHFKETFKLKRQEKRLVKKLKSEKQYGFWLGFFILFFWPIKFFLVATQKWLKKAWWILSFSVYKFFWLKIWYIDDFIVHKKSRWKWIWNNLFNNALEKIGENKCDYAMLVSHKKRKTSHWLYKKFWFTMISCGLFVFAYKKIKVKKKKKLW